MHTTHIRTADNQIMTADVRPMTARRSKLAMALSVALLLSPLALADDKHNHNKDSFTVSVSGQGQITAVPDEVVINASLRLQGPQSQELLNASNKTMAEVLAALKTAGIDNKSIQAGQLQLNQRWSHENGRQQPDGYEAVRPVQVRLNNIDRYPQVIDLLSRQGVNNFDGVAFDFSNRAELMDKALVLASKDASRQARLLGEAMGGKNCQPKQVSLSGMGMPQPMMEMAAFKVRGAAADAYQPGEQALNVNVSATFSCKL